MWFQVSEACICIFLILFLCVAQIGQKLPLGDVFPPATVHITQGALVAK